MELFFSLLHLLEEICLITTDIVIDEKHQEKDWSCFKMGPWFDIFTNARNKLCTQRSMFEMHLSLTFFNHV